MDMSPRRDLPAPSSLGGDKDDAIALVVVEKKGRMRTMATSPAVMHDEEFTYEVLRRAVEGLDRRAERLLENKIIAGVRRHLETSNPLFAEAAALANERVVTSFPTFKETNDEGGTASPSVWVSLMTYYAVKDAYRASSKYATVVVALNEELVADINPADGLNVMGQAWSEDEALAHAEIQRAREKGEISALLDVVMQDFPEEQRQAMAMDLDSCSMLKIAEEQQLFTDGKPDPARAWTRVRKARQKLARRLKNPKAPLRKEVFRLRELTAAGCGYLHDPESKRKT